MAIAADRLADFTYLQNSLTSVISILDKQATILDADRQLTDANISKLNELVAKTIDAIKDIVPSTNL